MVAINGHTARVAAFLRKPQELRLKLRGAFGLPGGVTRLPCACLDGNSLYVKSRNLVVVWDGDIHVTVSVGFG
jgi:hypothetical protein